MLRKLVKYDLKATSRVFFPVYLVVIVLAVLAAISNYVTAHTLADADVVNGLAVLFMVLYVIALVVLPFLTVFFCMRHFYDNFFKDEGYLMHTLPVTPAKLIWSKVITGGVWSLATSVIPAISGSIIATLSDIGGIPTFDFNRIFPNLVSVSPKTAVEDVVAIFLSIIIMLAMLLCFLLMLYASLSIGSLVPKHHRGITVLMIIAFFLAHVIVLVVVMVAAFNAANRGWLDPLAHTFEPVLNNFWPFLWVAFGCVMAYLVGFSAIYFLITHYIMKRRLNLQ
jgi:ABC-type transport system involved in multi-copper enzyme maturation permease subunit